MNAETATLAALGLIAIALVATCWALAALAILNNRIRRRKTAAQ